MNLSEAYSNLEQVLAPFLASRFLKEISGRRFINLQGDPNRYGRLFLGERPDQTILDRFDDVSHKITWHAANSLGKPPEVYRCNSSSSFGAQIRAFHENRYTVRIPDIRSFTPQLDQFIRSLEMIFQVPVEATAFWSAADGAAAVHHDNYDIFVLQVMGSKKWFVSTDLSPMPNPWQVMPDKPPKLENYLDLDLQTADLLYLPRGTAHRVEGLQESIHISIGFTPVTVRDAIIACIDHLSDLFPPLRELADADLASSLSTGKFGELGNRVRHGVDKLSELCRGEQFVADAIQRRSSKIIGDKLERLKGPREAPVLVLNSRVRHSPLAIAHLSGNERLIDFAYPGSHRYIHRGAEASVFFIAQTSEFNVHEVPGPIEDAVRLALVQEFVANGFLEVVA